MESADKIIETLKVADNEGTESPYWLLIDPLPIKDRLVFSTEDDPEGSYSADLDDEDAVKRITNAIPNCITGPFFSREDAENYLKARQYGYSKEAYVYCHSGYWSHKYKALCREIGVGK